MPDVKVYVVDRVTTKPGYGKKFVDGYLSEYAPGARQRNMSLISILVSPPLWSETESNVVTITWTVAGVAGWWSMTRQGRADPSIGRWWTEQEPLIVERTRSMAADASDLELLIDV